MKLPLSIIVISRDPATRQEVHNRFDALTSFPRLRILAIAFKAAFSI
jgi:hypothetical protein